MKRNVILIAVAVIVAVAVAACSGSKKDAEATEETEEVVEVAPVGGATELDIEGLTALTEKSEVTSEDCDFLLDQFEVMVKRVEGMTPEEAKAYGKSLSEEELGGLMVIGFGLEAAKQGGKLSEAQLKRYEELQAKDPSKQ